MWTNSVFRPSGRVSAAAGLRTTLVPVNTVHPLPGDAVQLAARLAAERRDPVIQLLAFTEIPLAEDIDVPLDRLEDVVRDLLGEARARAGRFGVAVHGRHVRTRDAAEVILAEADRCDAQAIVIGADGLAAATHRQALHDLTVRQILEAARQRVILIQPVRGAA
jgi:nucleotide-binding universal stress UspA family protein